MKEERLLHFVSTNLSNIDAYHKENMANAGFLVQLGLFGSVITENIWPPTWVEVIVPYPELMTFIVYGFLWFLIHYYTRWQLINKRVAAIYSSGLTRAYLYLSTHELTDEDRKISDSDAHRPSAFKDAVNKIIYVPGGFQKMDVSTRGYPMFIAREIQEQFEKGSGAVSLEVLFTYSNFVLLGIMAAKVFF